MRPFGIDDVELLRQARQHATELSDDWRTANWSPDYGAVVPSPGPVGRSLRSARRGAGAALIAIGRQLLPAETELLGPVSIRRADEGCL